MSGTTDDVARCGGDTSGTVACPHSRPKPATVHHRSGLQMLTGNTSALSFASTTTPLWQLCWQKNRSVFRRLDCTALGWTPGNCAVREKAEDLTERRAGDHTGDHAKQWHLQHRKRPPDRCSARGRLAASVGGRSHVAEGRGITPGDGAGPAKTMPPTRKIKRTTPNHSLGKRQPRSLFLRKCAAKLS